MGDGSERKRRDLRRVRLQMVPRIRERKDGEFQVPPDHFGQCGSPMSQLSASTTDGSRTGLSSTRGWNPSNGLGSVSDAIWTVVLANPEKAGLEGIHNLADKHLQG